MKRCIAFCLALGAAISLTACGGGDTEGGLLCEASGIRPDTVLLSVDGRDVSAQRYLYWLAYACDYIADYYDSGEGIQWGDTVSGQSLEDYAKDQALQNAALYATVETWAEDYGCTLTDEDRTAMDREWAARAAQYGGEEAYLAVLARMGLDRAVHFGDLHTDLIQFLRRIDNFHADTVGQRFERDIECAHSCSSCAPFCCTALPAVRYRTGFLLIIIIERSVKNNIVRAAFSQPGKNARSSAAMY